MDDTVLLFDSLITEMPMPVLREESVVKTSSEKVDAIVLLSPMLTDTVEGAALRLEAMELSGEVPLDEENMP